MDASKAPETEKRPSTPRYAYVVLLVCFLIMTLVFGAQYCFGVFLKPMIAEYDWSRAATSGPFALFMIVTGVLSVVTGRLSDRLGPRLVITVCSLMLGIGYFLMSLISNLWQLYLVYGVVIAAGSAGMYTPLVAMITRWFPDKQGLTAGIGISGIGFGIGVVPILASSMIVAYNWRTSSLILGFVCLVLLTLLGQFARTAPVLNHQRQVSNPSLPLSPRKEFTFKQAIHTRLFWLLFIAWFCYGFYFHAGMVHIVPYASDIGLSVTAAASVLTTIGLVGTASRIGLGFSGDRFGHKTIVIISVAALTLAFSGLAASRSVWMLYSFGIVFGCFSGIGVLLAPMVADFFGFKALGVIVGALVLANTMGGAISPPLAGGVYDATGSYQLAFIACGVLGLTSVILMYLVKPSSGAG